MRPYLELLERYDARWERLEDLVESCFTQHSSLTPPGDSARSAASSSSTLSALSTPSASPTLPNLKELGAAVAILKRIQDARRAVRLDAMKLEVSQTDDGRSDADDDEAISGILRRLETNGDICATDEVDEDEV